METSSGHIKNLFKHSIIYGVGLFLKKAIGFFLIPLYTHQFTHPQYGKLAILYLYSSALFIFLSLGLNDAFFKQFTSSKNNEKKVFSRFFIFRMIYTSLFLLLFIVFSDTISRVLLTTGDSYLIKLATLTIWIETIASPSLLILRIKDKSLRFIIVNTLRFAVNLGLNILFVLYYKMGVGGILLGNLLSGFILFFLVYPEIHKYFIFTLKWKPIKKLLTYGLPLLPLTFVIMGIDLADRWLIKAISGLGKAGIYTLGYQFGAVMGIIVHGFRISWISFFFNNPDRKETFAESAKIFLHLSLILWGILSLFTREIFHIMVAKEYHSAISIVPIIAFSYIIFGLEEIFSAGFFIKSRTALLFPISLISLLINILLNIILIPVLDIVGASISTFISFLVFAVASYYIANRFFPVKYDFKVIFSSLTVAIILYFIPYLAGNNLILRVISFIILCSIIIWKEKVRLRKLIKKFIPSLV